MALTLLAANNAQTVLAAGISASATSLTVNSGTGSLFPAPSDGVSFFKLTLIDAATGQLTEIMHVTARTGDTMKIERGQEGTTARAWSANDIAANMMTAGTLNYILANFQPLDATLTALAGLATGANKLPYFTGTDTASQTDLTSVGRDIIGKGTIADILTYLGLVNNGAVGRLIGMQIIKTSGTYTKTPGAMFADVIAIGGGGGGGWATSTANYNAAGGGGGGGGMARGLFNLSAISTVLVTIGAGGNGGIASTITNATHGGTTTFGSYLSAGGGQPGNGCTASGSSASCGMGGQGGTSTVGALLCNGYAGLPGVMATPTAVGGTVGSGLGGGSFISGPGGYGAGGNGAATSGGTQNVNGNPGNAGVIIILEYA